MESFIAIVEKTICNLQTQIQGATNFYKKIIQALLSKFLAYTEKLDRMRGDDFGKHS